MEGSDFSHVASQSARYYLSEEFAEDLEGIDIHG